MTSQLSLKPQPYIEEFESLRGLAALLILFLHIASWNPLLDLAFLKNSTLMVDLFFVLSGFVIAMIYAENIRSGQDVAQFQFLRLGRLYPLHVLFLLPYPAFELAKYALIQCCGADIQLTSKFDQAYFTALVQHLLLIQAIGPAGQFQIFNGPSWSISVEFYTYLIFALAVLWLGRWKYHGFAAIAALALVLILTGQTFGFDLLLRSLAGFFIGCLTALAASQLRLALPALLSLLPLLALAAYLQLKPVGTYDSAIFLLTAALLLSLALRRDGLLNRILQHRLLVWLGTLSYAIYMSHTPVTWFLQVIVRRLFGKIVFAVQGDPFATQMSLPEIQIMMLATIALTLLVSWLAHILIERPIRAWSRRLVHAGQSTATT